MKGTKFLIGLLAILGGLVAIFFVLNSESALVIHPKGIIADGQLDLIITNILLMLAIIVPTYIFLFKTVWSAKKRTEKHDPDHSHTPFSETLLWVIPCIIVLPMALITWNETHRLDPRQPIESDAKPLTIQVVALDWKWLFIYPEQGIASLNFVQFPEATPIRFELSADGSPMNSFWIPQLSGQIYCMTGMVTELHVMANGPGEYAGRAAEINGSGYARMLFTAKSTTASDFDTWVAEVKKSPLKLTDSTYDQLTKRSKNDPIALYADVKQDLFKQIVNRHMP